MKTIYKGLAVAVIQILIVLSVGGKLLYDRATKPRVWVRTASIDPDLPIRGRYLTLNLEVHTSEPMQPQDPKQPRPVFRRLLCGSGSGERPACRPQD